MSHFTSVKVKKAASVYFDGKVTSRTVEFANGETKSLGIMLPGEYEFNTAAPELMEIQSGSLQVQLKGESGWRPVKGGEAFEVPGDSSFKVQVSEVTDYICSYLN